MPGGALTARNGDEKGATNAGENAANTFSQGHYKPPFKFGMGGVPLGNEFSIVTDEDANDILEGAWWLRANDWQYSRGMSNPRFNKGSRRRAISPSATGGIPQWIPMPELEPTSGSASSGQKRIFAIVSPPIPTSVDGKTIRRIVIFDNHPDSLRLVLDSGVSSRER